MALVSRVQPDGRYENLQNYILGGGARPPPQAVRGFDQSARQPVAPPNSGLPGVRNPIPTSSARPGKQTNQRIPYSRVGYEFPTTLGPDSEILLQEGDIAFVGRIMSKGNGTNRVSKVGSLRQLNAMFGNHDPTNRGILTMSANENPFGNPTATSWPERWAKCTAVGEWNPDGVIIGTEHEHGGPHPMVGTSDSSPGALFNVCVQGPTPLKNNVAAPGNIHSGYTVGTEQNIDSNPRVLDKVFVGLFCKENRDAVGRNIYYSFYYKPFTSRQLLYVDLTGARSARAPPATGSLNYTAGPTAAEFVRMVSAWRIGTIMDSKLTPSRVTLNVIIEPWPLEWLQDEFNEYIGASLALRMLLNGSKTFEAVEAVDQARDIMDEDKGGGMTILDLATESDAALRLDDEGVDVNPFEYGKTIPGLRAELAAYETYDERKKRWDAATEATKKRMKLKNPGPPPVPSAPLSLFYERWSNYSTLLDVEKFIDELYAAPNLPDADQVQEGTRIALAAALQDEAEIMESFTKDQRETVADARKVETFLARVKPHLQLFRKIILDGHSFWVTSTTEGAASDSE